MHKLNLIGVAICLASTSAVALDQGEYRLNGFGTAAISHVAGAQDGKGYGISGQTTDSWRGDQLSKLGGQFTYGVTDQLAATIQTVAKPEQDDWRLQLEWAYLAYSVNDQLTVRAGRLRPNAFMFSETLDVGYSYPWLRLPDEVYSQMPISNYEGADVLYNLPTSLGTLALQASYGQAVNRNIFIHALDDRLDADYKKLLTGSVSLATESLGTFRYSYTESTLSVDHSDEFKGKFMSLGHQFDDGAWVTNAEVINRRSPISEHDAFYVMVGHHFGDFLPHVTYAQHDESDAGRDSSWAFGLNYSVNANITLKSEYKRVESTNHYNGSFVPAYNTSEPTFDWDILSIGADFVF